MDDFRVIWLAPHCGRCWQHTEVYWCQDGAFDPCPDCGRQARRYVLADGEQWEQPPS